MTARRQHRKASLIALGATLLLAACGGGGGGHSGAAVALSYARNPALYGINLAATANTPTLASGTATSWSIAPALPAGLAFDTVTGVVSGTPTSLAPLATYTVTAATASAPVSADLRIGVVQDDDVAVGAAGDDTLALFGVDLATAKLRPLSFVHCDPSELGPRGLIAGRDGTTFYALDAASSKITVFDVDRAAGRIARRNAVATDAGPFQIVLHPSADFAYVACRDAGTLLCYAIDPFTGDLTQQGAALATGLQPESLAIDASGAHLYVGNRGDMTLSTFALDPSTHMPSSAGPALALAAEPMALAFGADAGFLYALLSDNVSILSLDAATGLPTLMSSVAAGSATAQLALDPTGRFLFVAVEGDDAVRAYAVQPGTGMLSAIGSPFATADRPVALEVDTTGQWLYVTQAGAHEIAVLKIDGASGALSSVDACRSRKAPLSMALLRADHALAPAPTFAYVVNGSSQDVSMYKVDATTGAMTENLPTVPAGTNPAAVALDPFGRFAFVVNSGSQDVTTFAIDALSGVLTDSGTPAAAGTDPRALAVDRSGRFLYVANYGSDDVSMFAIDQASGSLSSLGTMPAGDGPQGAFVEATGRFLYVANGVSSNLSVFGIDPASGALAPVTNMIPANGKPRGLASHPSGRVLYVALENVNITAAFTVDAQTGSLTLLSSRYTGPQPSSIAVDPFGRFAFASFQDQVATGGINRFALGKKGGLKAPTTLAAGSNPIDSAIDLGGRFLYVVNQDGDDVSTFKVSQAGAVPQVPTASGVAPKSIALLGRYQ